jgi:hypothetical protein
MKIQANLPTLGKGKLIFRHCCPCWARKNENLGEFAQAGQGQSIFLAWLPKLGKLK